MKQLLAAGAAILWLGGCRAVGPDYERPAIATPPAFGNGETESLDARAVATWWRTLGDERLAALVETVLDSNLDLAAAVERVEVARASYGIVAADRYPTIDATGSYQRTRAVTGSSQDDWRVGGTVAWEIDLFGRVRRSVEASLAAFEAQIEDLRGARIALVAETVATYLQALSLQERLAIAARNVEGQERSLDIADQRFDAGMAAGLDPAQARVNLSSTRASVPALELALRRALHRLAVLSGEAPRALVGELGGARPLPALPSELLVGLPADLIRNRPDIRGLERRLAAQNAQVGVATAALYPSIRLAGSWDWLAADPADLFDVDSALGGIGPLVSLPLFNAGRLRSRVDAEEATLRQLHLQLRQRVLVAQEEVENAIVAIARDRARAELLAEAVAAARQSVDLARQLYTSGQSDFQNVLDAQRSLFAFEDQLAVARLQTLLDLVELYRALGGGWEPADARPAEATSTE